MWGRKSKGKYEEGGKESNMWEEYTPLLTNAQKYLNETKISLNNSFKSILNDIAIPLIYFKRGML